MVSTSLNTNENNRIDAENTVRLYNEKTQMKTGKQPSAYTHSYGCQQNVADGETLEGLLLEMGFTLAEVPEEADIVIYNTCAIRENAEDRVFGNIGALKEAKLKNPAMIIGLCGCMVQQKHIFDKITESYPFVDLMFGAGAMHTLPVLLADKLNKGGKIFQINNPTSEIVENLPVERISSIKASVPIMTGCDNFCSYCVVPYVRGRERSRKPEMILSDVENLVSQGFKEITLLGQNVNSYGRGLEKEYSFSKLLSSIAQIPGKFRIRFMTSHPKDCTQELLDTMAKYDNICNHIHLPVQSGSNRILKEMNRGYTTEHYLNVIHYAKKTIPNVTFTSDIIIGFPGETEEDFMETMRLVDTIGYSSLFTFAYSPRKGTKAAEMKNELLQSKKSERFHQLLELQRKKANEYHSSLVGQTLEVLIEGRSKNQPELLTGHTDGNVIVLIDAPESTIGTFQPVTITNYYNWAIQGYLNTK